MGEISKIAWTALLAAMLCLVAGLAQGFSVTHFKPKFGVVRERLDVVSMEVPSARVSAALTGEVIAQVHVVTPALVAVRKTLSVALRAFAIAVSCATRTAKSPRPRACADGRALFDSSRAPALLADKSSPAPHSTSGFWAEAFSLHRGWTARLLRSFRPPTVGAERGKSVVPGAVLSEGIFGTPLLAVVAPFLVGRAPRPEAIRCLACFVREYQQGSIVSLGHKSIVTR